MAKIIQQGFHKTYKEVCQTIHDCTRLQPNMYLRQPWGGMGGGERNVILYTQKLIQLTEEEIKNWIVGGCSYQWPLPDKRKFCNDKLI